MQRCAPGYQSILVQSHPSSEGGHRLAVEIRPLAGEVFPSHLLVECAAEMRTDYPIGTVFRICATLKQKEDCRPHLYSYHGWPFEVISKAP